MMISRTTSAAASSLVKNAVLSTRATTKTTAMLRMNSISTVRRSALERITTGNNNVVSTTRQATLSTNRNQIIRTQSSSTTTTSTTSAASSSASGASSTASSSSSSNVPLLETSVACGAGLLVVAAGSYAVEQFTSSDIPEFDPSRTRFDQSTFWGRYCTMILKCDPLLLKYTQDDCLQAKSMVENYQNLIANPPTGVTNIHHTLWEAQRIMNGAIHPDSGEFIPRPFRVSGFVPYNGPISVAMVASSTTPTLLFWNWVNQSQNAMVNYFNRNASTPLSNETLAKSYVAAVSSALVVAFGLATFVQKRFKPDEAKKLLRFVAFPSAVVASSLNCYIVRSPEITTGVPLMDSNGQVVLEDETSKIAAKRGVYETTASRALLQMPVFFLPPLLLSSVFKNTLIKQPHLATPITTFLLLVSFGFGFPATVAVFPQIREISIQDCEEKYQHLRDPNTNQPYKALYYNKGL